MLGCGEKFLVKNSFALTSIITGIKFHGFVIESNDNIYLYQRQWFLNFQVHILPGDLLKIPVLKTHLTRF